MFGEQMNWKGWKDIKDLATKHGFKNVAARMQLNDDCWMSSGEFGRSQVQICDTLRYAIDENEALNLAQQMDEEFSTNYGLY